MKHSLRALLMKLLQWHVVGAVCFAAVIPAVNIVDYLRGRTELDSTILGSWVHEGIFMFGVMLAFSPLLLLGLFVWWRLGTRYRWLESSRAVRLVALGLYSLLLVNVITTVVLAWKHALPRPSEYFSSGAMLIQVVFVVCWAILPRLLVPRLRARLV